MATTRKRLTRLQSLEARRNHLLRELARVDQRRHDAIRAEQAAGRSLTAIAGELGVTRQALSKYLDRRGRDHA